MLTEDCLFQVQESKPLKAFSFAGEAGLLAVFNASDADAVLVTISPSDIGGLVGDAFAVCEFFSGDVFVMDRNEEKPILLNCMECDYFNVVTVKNGIALIGLVNKYNAPKAILNSKITNNNIEIQLLENGLFKALLPSKPIAIKINNNIVNDYCFEDNILTIEINSGNDDENTLLINY